MGAGASDHGHEIDGKAVWREIRELLNPESRDFWVVAVYAAGVGLLSLSVAAAIQSLVNSIAWGSLLQPIIVFTVVLLVVLGLESIMRLLQIYTIEVLYRRFYLRKAGEMLMHQTTVRNDQTNDPALLANRYFEIMNVQKSMGMVLLDGIALALQTLIGLLLLAFYHPLFLAFDVLMIALIYTTLRVLFSKTANAVVHESHAKYQVADWLEDISKCPQHFRSKKSRQFVYERSDSLLSEYISARRDYFSGLLGHSIGFNVIYALASSALLGLGGYLVIKEQLALGQLVAAELVVTLIVAGLAKIAPKLEGIFDLVATAKKFGAYFSQPKIENTGLPLNVAEGNFELTARGVSYVEPGGRQTLNGVDFTIHPKERVLLRGAKEAGKSTLLQCVAGEMRPTSGSFLLGGQPYFDIRIEDLRDHVVWVRFPHLVHGSFLDQFRTLQPNVAPGEIREALSRIGAESLLEKLPNGLQTALTPGGLPLSRSQLIQLAVARALTAKPKVLVIDEILDGLEPTTRSRILEGLLDKQNDFTVVVSSQFSEDQNKFSRRIEMAQGRITKDERLN